MKKTNVLVFSIAVDATKVPRSLIIYTSRKFIIGGDFLHHATPTHHLGNQYMQRILENKHTEADRKEAIELA